MTPTPDQTPERPKTESLALIICDREGYPVGGHEERQPQGEYVRADECLKMEQEYERELTTLRARLVEAEKVRDAAYREAEILRTNATYVKKVLDCANRYMPDLVKGAITVEGAIQERDALRATNATLAERVRSLEEALTALSNSANAAAEWCNTSMMDDEIMHAESILTDSASPDPVLPIKLAFCSLHQAWLVAHHRSCMNETMDALAVVLGLDPMNPSKGLSTPGAAVGKEGE